MWTFDILLHLGKDFEDLDTARQDRVKDLFTIPHYKVTGLNNAPVLKF